MSPRNVSQVLAALDMSVLADAEPLSLEVGPVRLSLRCAAPLREELAAYFSDALAAAGPVQLSIDVLDQQGLDPAPNWTDWAREPGKIGRKDAIHDLADGRLVHKWRTGVTFLQSPAHLVAFGPCAQHPNQVINFVNTQILNICQRDNWQICHAAAITDGTRSLAIAGLSGGGKSTTVLRLMDLPKVAFVTNDRLLVKAGSPAPQALGIPKQPRINPGTILHNAKLHPMLTPARLDTLAQLPPSDLWELEEKHDLMIAQIYGDNRVRFEAPLSHFWVLNWQRDLDRPTTVTEVALPDRPDLLAAIMKGAGPFYQDATGRFLQDSDPLDADAYLAALAGVQVFEVGGGIDFDALFAAGKALFKGAT